MRRKRCLLAGVILCISLGLTGCLKPTRGDVIESEYYQELKEENNKLTNQLKSQKKRADSLDKKLKAVNQTSGDQKLADYQKNVKDSTIVKMTFGSKAVKNESFAVTNAAVCNYAKEIVVNCYRMIGITPNELDKKYDDVYSYVLIDEDNTAYEFEVYGNSYIVFDAIPANVYAYNNASIIGEGLIDASLQKKYASFAERIADAQIVVNDKTMKFRDTAVKASKVFLKIKDNKITEPDFDVSDWAEYRFYTYGTITKVLLSDENTICIEDKNGKQSFYQISKKNLNRLEKILEE